MIVGCPKEIKPQEGRVGLLPADVAELVRFKHTVLIQKNAGLAAGATDEQYRAVGAQIIEHAEEIFARSDLIVKVNYIDMYIHSLHITYDMSFHICCFLCLGFFCAFS